MEKQIDKAFNDSIGVIMTILDESNASFTVKTVIKGELWKLCDRKIKPMAKGEDYDEDRGNV